MAFDSSTALGTIDHQRQHGEKQLGDGDDRSARWQRRRSTTTRQGSLDGKKRASSMGTRVSPAALDHRDGDDSSDVLMFDLVFSFGCNMAPKARASAKTGGNGNAELMATT
ncbi:hypothetical protein E2562_033207 [Oryza meyeriana var. granulata]|uniref:Uncharacterized protein n=1 Tax=Oryza meyeriana var. granulata TaxID=110450 RepID=A0A6G1CVV9_9ORYZ|nr:hypothetical protein E2562_033207 [Oryza meyeriana var. granulata]